MIEIKIPSKTFICGEYVALNGGPAIIVNTPPEFSISITDKKNINNLQLYQGSPSFKYFKDNEEFFSNLSFDFHDPHLNKGGFGASGAKFNALVTVKKILTEMPLFNYLDVRKKLLFYSKQRQSGYDVISQFNGKVCYINLDEKVVERMGWPFKDHNIYIVRTGNKVNTHQHLQDLKLTKFSQLSKISSQAFVELKNKKFTHFCDAINGYYQRLVDLNLICTSSLLLTEKIKSETSHFPIVKACGAAGSDTILLVAHINDHAKTLSYVQDLDLELVFSGQNLSHGMSIDSDLVTEEEAYV